MIGRRPRFADRVRAFRPGLGSALALVIIAGGLWGATAAYSDFRDISARLAAAKAERDAAMRTLRP